MPSPAETRRWGRRDAEDGEGLQGVALTLTSSGNYLEGRHGVGLHIEARVASLIEGSVVRLL